MADKTFKAQDKNGKPLFSVEYDDGELDVTLDGSEAEAAAYAQEHEEELLTHFKDVIKQKIIDGKEPVTPEKLAEMQNGLRNDAATGSGASAKLNSLALRATHEVVTDLAKDDKQVIKQTARGGTVEKKIVSGDTLEADQATIRADRENYRKTFNDKSGQEKDGKPVISKEPSETTKQIQRYMDFLQDGEHEKLDGVKISRVDGLRGKKTNDSIAAVLGDDAKKLSDESVLQKLREKVKGDEYTRDTLTNGMDVTQGKEKGAEEIKNFLKGEKIEPVKDKDGTIKIDDSIKAYEKTLEKSADATTKPTQEAAPQTQTQPNIQGNAAGIADAEMQKKAASPSMG